MRLDYLLAAMRYRIKAEGIYHLRIETLATRRGPIFIPLFKPRKKNRITLKGVDKRMPLERLWRRWR